MKKYHLFRDQYFLTFFWSVFLRSTHHVIFWNRNSCFGPWKIWKTLQKILASKNHHFIERFCRVKSHDAKNMFIFCDKIIGKSFHFLMHFWWNAKTHCFSESIGSGYNHFGKIVRFRCWFSVTIYRYKNDIFSVDVRISTFLYRFF